MSERPILFSGPMVVALLSGRKTQTRRVVKPQPRWEEQQGCRGAGWRWERPRGVGHLRSWPNQAEFAAEMARLFCPYGVPGDLLWVRETWRVSSEGNHTPDGVNGTKRIYCVYRANDRGWYPGARQQRTDFLTPQDDDLAARAWGKGKSGNWRPSIHMPRWASRITLRITDVRVQRVQDISEEDARAEGIADGGCLSCGDSEPCGCLSPHPSARDSFVLLWDSINRSRGYGWYVDPWVWALSLEVVK